MPNSNASGCSADCVDDVLITPELVQRPSRDPDYAAENRAFAMLAQEMANNPGGIMQKVAELVMELCRADSAGISILEPAGAEGVLRWPAAAGAFAAHMQGTMPRDSLPCGTAISRNHVLLFSEAEKFFPALRIPEPRIHESLLAPWEVNGKVVGTVWALTHTPEHRFDAEDARILQSLARFASAAWQLISAVRDAETTRQELEQRVDERTHALSESNKALSESEANYRTLFDSMDEGYFLTEVLFDDAGRPVDILYLDANRSAKRMLGQDFTGRRLREIDSHFEHYWYEIFGRVARTGIGERLEQYAAPLDGWYDLYVFKVGSPNESRVANIFKDITARKRREANLAFLAEISEDLAHLSSADEMMQCVGAKIGAYMNVATIYFADIGEPQEQEMTVSYFWGKNDMPNSLGTFRIRDYLAEEFERAGRAGEITVVRDTQTDPRTDARACASCQIGAFIVVPFHRNGKWKHFLSINNAQARDWREDEIELFHELSNRIFPRLERARVEAALRESEALLQKACSTETVGVLFFSLDGRMTEANDSFVRMSGYTREELINIMHWEMLTPKEFRDVTVRAAGELATLGETSPYEKQLLRKDGSRRWGLFAPTRLSGSGSESKCVEFILDITKSKRAEEDLRQSEQRFRLLVENVREYALFQTDREGAITSWNPGAERLFGYTSAEMLARHASRLLSPEDRESGILDRELARVMAGERQEDARWMLRKDGTRFWAQSVTEPVRDDTGQLRGMAKVLRDETERERADQALRGSLAEKEVLLKEVHHRVKNNLQVITSLLNMQARQVENPDVLALFDEARNRVFAVAAIHELLYRANSFAAVDLAAYARQLVPDLVRLYGAEDRIRATVAGDGVTLELERAAPYGLLLNELVSNVCKHAFAPGQNGELAVAVKRDREQISLQVADTGVGLPEEFDYRRATSLGLQLVQRLATQLGGRIQVRSGPSKGTMVEVCLPTIVRSG